MTEIFKIEKDVPITKRCYNRPYKYPFREMVVGDSFVVSSDDARYNAVAGAVGNATRHGLGKFSIRAFDGGCRIWKVE